MDYKTTFFSLLLTAALFVAACSTAPRQRLAGTLLDPYCMPDGSTLLVQYSNSRGSFLGTKGRRVYCPWYEAHRRIQTVGIE